MRQRPTVLYLSGPPSYLERDLGADAIDRGIDHLKRIIDATGCRVLMDHHALRDAHFATRFQALWETGHVTTAAAYLGLPVSALESRRHTLWGGVRKPPARAGHPGAIMTPVRRRFAKGGHAE